MRQKGIRASIPPRSEAYVTSGADVESSAGPSKVKLVKFIPPLIPIIGPVVLPGRKRARRPPPARIHVVPSVVPVFVADETPKAREKLPVSPRSFTKGIVVP